MAKLKKGDTVEVLAGKDKGAKGKILSIGDDNRVVVEGVNIQKRHIKAGARQSVPQGGILDRPGPIHISNVRLWSEKLEKSVRVGFEIDAEGNKSRVARGQGVSGTALD